MCSVNGMWFHFPCVGLRHHDNVGASCLDKSVVSVFALGILFTVKILSDYFGKGLQETIEYGFSSTD